MSRSRINEADHVPNQATDPLASCLPQLQMQMKKVVSDITAEETISHHHLHPLYTP
jgi:hypothetical protein